MIGYRAVTPAQKRKNLRLGEGGEDSCVAAIAEKAEFNYF